MRVLIAAGGTAGHINPALAIAGAIKKADPTAEIHFAGRKEGMEYRLVTQAGYPFHHIEITGFQRKLSLNNIKRNIITLWNLALSGPKAKKMMRDIQPDLVIGCGGYVSGPVVRCAAKKGIKTAIHEQNAFPGATNKLLAPDVDIVFAAVPAAVEKLSDPMYISLYETYLKTQEAYTFYYAPQLVNYLELETRFENLARLKLLAGRTQYLEGAGTLDELVWDTLDSFKLDYGT